MITFFFQEMNKQNKFSKIKRKHCLRVFKVNRINQSTKGGIRIMNEFSN